MPKKASGTERSGKRGRRYYRLTADGAIDREQVGRPEGEGAIGVILKTPDGDVVHEVSTRIGWVEDHHVAEYRALVSGLALARGHGVDDLRVSLDSRLVVNQVKGVSQVRAKHLKTHWRDAIALVAEFRDVRISWVPRKQNRDADKLAGKALGR